MGAWDVLAMRRRRRPAMGSGGRRGFEIRKTTIAFPSQIWDLRISDVMKPLPCTGVKRNRPRLQGLSVRSPVDRPLPSTGIPYKHKLTKDKVEVSHG